MLCKICQSLQWFESEAKHHASYRDLLESANAGCDFCTAILQRDLEKRRRDVGNKLVSEPVEGNTEKRWADGEIIAKFEDSRIGGSATVEDDDGKEDDDEDVEGVEDEDEDEEDDDDDSAPLSTQIFYKMFPAFHERGLLEISQAGDAQGLHEEFWWWVKNDDPLSPSVGHLERYVEPDPSSTSSLLYETQWHKNCLASHKTCPPDQEYPLPTRILDLGLPGGSQDPYLLVTKGRIGKYIALSHCWGGELPLSTVTNTLASRQAGISYDEFPKSFQDAIVITKRLGFQYLWIDSLCIIQDSKVDWASEAARMGTVYKHAAITISANVAANCHAGILQHRNVDTIIELPCVDTNAGITGHLQVRINTEPDYTDDPPSEGYDFTSKRGWTLQEDRLAPRTLRFTKWGKQWVCHTAYLDERRPYATASSSGNTPDKIDAVYASYILPSYDRSPDEIESTITDIKEHGQNTEQLWSFLLTEFLKRSLTYTTDIFPSLSGLAREIQKMNKMEYVAGLWREDIHAGLLWAVPGCGQPTTSYTAPSWGWGSLTYSKGSAEPGKQFGNDIYPYSSFIVLRDPKFEAEIVHLSVENTHDDPYGEVKSASLTIRGLWKDAKNSIFGRAVIDDPGQPRMVTRETTDGTIMLNALRDEHRPLLSFDCISDAHFDKMQSAFKEESEGQPESGAGTSGNPDHLWERLSFVQILKGSVDADQYNPQTDSYEKIYEWAHFALILESTEGKMGEFRRIGLAQIPDFEDMGTEGWESREVTIV